ncbi:MAG: hypothetical protein AAGF90_00115 [Pseudomonadota bacterium]
MGEFIRRSDGAVTLDWVALAATVVIIGVALTYAVYGTGDGSGGVAGVVEGFAAESRQAAENLAGAVPEALPGAAGPGGGGSGSASGTGLGGGGSAASSAAASSAAAD